MTARQAVNQLKKEIDIVCVDPGTYNTFLILGYHAACSGKEIKATVILMRDGKEVARCPRTPWRESK
jgi:hypothetical protein